MAGGAGTRLWPISRRLRPKQLMRLFDGESPLQMAAKRLESLFDPARTWIITSAAYLDLVADELPRLPRENLIGEPTGRDTANAIGLAAHLIARRDPSATMAVFTADHIIRPQQPFEAAIRAGLDAAEAHPAALVTFGITPTAAHTGYGYVRRGATASPGVQRVAEFKEKPTLTVAENYLASGEYLWNSGMFAWRVAAIIDELRRHLPENADALAALADGWGRLPAEEIARRFESLRKISIDFGVMEKARHVLMVEMNCEWLDLGSWTAVAKMAEPDEQGNIALVAESVVMSGMNNIVVSDQPHLVALLGVDDLVVIHSPDATLICHRERVEEIKELANRRIQRFGERFE